MPEKFDPYHRWLGIPADEQPPNHYRLLAIGLFEADHEAIRDAVEQRMAHVRTYQLGPHSAISQKILNELAAAKACLLNPAKKAAYDELLRQRDAASSEPANASKADALDPGLAAVFETGIPSTSVSAAKGRKKKPRPKPVGLIVAATLTVAALGTAAVWWGSGHDNTPSEKGIAKSDSQAKSAAPAKEAAPKPPEPLKKDVTVPIAKDSAAAAAPKKNLKSEDLKSEIPKPAPEAVAQVKPQAKTDTVVETKPATEKSPTEKSITEKPQPNEPQAAAKKLAPPATDEQKRLAGEIDEVYKPGEAKTQAAKAALARKLLEDGRKNEANRAEQFVLLRRAGEVARDAGEADLMLEAVDAIGDAGFDIQPYQVKARFLKRLVEQALAGGATQLSTISACCVKFAEEAAANGAGDEALDVLDAAKKSLPKSIMQAQTALRTAKAVLAHARTPADKTEREKKVDDAQAEVDAIKAVQSALADCAKGLQEAQHEQEAIQAAQEKLKTDPNDA